MVVLTIVFALPFCIWFGVIVFVCLGILLLFGFGLRSDVFLLDICVFACVFIVCLFVAFD